MAFAPFNLFTEVTRPFVNLEKIGDIGRGLDIGSGLGSIALNTLGLTQGTLLSNLVRLGLGGYGFLVDTVTGERMIFQYNVLGRESGGAEYDRQQVLGRSIPRLTYRGGKVRVLELPITFTMQEITRADIRRNMRWLQSLSYPDYNGSDELSLSPHPVCVIQGQLYSQDLWVVEQFGVELGQALDPITQLPSEVTVNLTLLEVADKAKSRSEVIRL